VPIGGIAKPVQIVHLGGDRNDNGNTGNGQGNEFYPVLKKRKNNGGEDSQNSRKQKRLVDPVTHLVEEQRFGGYLKRSNVGAKKESGGQHQRHLIAFLDIRA